MCRKTFGFLALDPVTFLCWADGLWQLHHVFLGSWVHVVLLPGKGHVVTEVSTGHVCFLSIRDGMLVPSLSTIDISMNFSIYLSMYSFVLFGVQRGLPCVFLLEIYAQRCVFYSYSMLINKHYQLKFPSSSLLGVALKIALWKPHQTHTHTHMHTQRDYLTLKRK